MRLHKGVGWRIKGSSTAGCQPVLLRCPSAPLACRGCTRMSRLLVPHLQALPEQDNKTSAAEAEAKDQSGVVIEVEAQGALAPSGSGATLSKLPSNDWGELALAREWSDELPADNNKAPKGTGFLIAIIVALSFVTWQVTRVLGRAHSQGSFPWQQSATSQAAVAPSSSPSKATGLSKSSKPNIQDQATESPTASTSSTLLRRSSSSREAPLDVAEQAAKSPQSSLQQTAAAIATATTASATSEQHPRPASPAPLPQPTPAADPVVGESLLPEAAATSSAARALPTTPQPSEPSTNTPPPASTHTAWGDAAAPVAPAIEPPATMSMDLPQQPLPPIPPSRFTSQVKVIPAPVPPITKAVDPAALDLISKDQSLPAMRDRVGVALRAAAAAGEASQRAAAYAAAASSAASRAAEAAERAAAAAAEAQAGLDGAAEATIAQYEIRVARAATAAKEAEQRAASAAAVATSYEDVGNTQAVIAERAASSITSPSHNQGPLLTRLQTMLKSAVDGIISGHGGN